MKTDFRKVFLTFVFTLVFVANAQAEGDFFKELKNWGGLKDRLEEKGVTAEVVYTGEYWANVKGGLKYDQTYLSNLDITMSLDTQAAGLWPNGTFYVYVLDNSGGEKLTGEIVGDLQAISNIEAPRTTRLFELWYEHRFWEDKLSTLVGLHDLNSEFAVTEYGSLFINSSFGINAEIAAGARPSIFPLAVLGSRIKYSPNETWDFLFGVYDGDPGDPDISEHLPRSVFAGDQGVFLVLETAFHYELGENDLPGTYKVGYWHNTGEFNDVLDTDAAGTELIRDNNMGGYIVLDQMVYREKNDQGLGIFLQAGGAPKYINEVDHYIGGGFHYTGLFPNRDEDILGVAVAYASISNDLVDNAGRKDAETAVEVTYRAQICENFTLQPNIQFIFDPGADPAVNNAVAAGLRFEIAI